MGFYSAQKKRDPLLRRSLVCWGGLIYWTSAVPGAVTVSAIMAMAMIGSVVTVLMVVVAFWGTTIAVMVAVVVVRRDTACGCKECENGEKQGFHE